MYLSCPIALVYEPRCGGAVSVNEYSCAHGAQLNFGDLTLYLTYEWILLVITNMLYIFTLFSHGIAGYFLCIIFIGNSLQVKIRNLARFTLLTMWLLRFISLRYLAIFFYHNDGAISRRKGFIGLL